MFAAAIKAGYRLFDTASDTGPWYKSEGEVGESFKLAVKDFDGNEDEKLEFKRKLMIETKMHPQDFHEEQAKASVANSFKHAGEEYIDIYLLHYPNCGPPDYKGICQKRSKDEGSFLTAWSVLEGHYDQGNIGAIGVANFDVRQLRELLEKAKFKPNIVQSWFDPYHQPWELVQFCRDHGIIFQAYSSLGTQWSHRAETNYRNPILSEPDLVFLAEKYSKSVPQIVLRWLLQEDILVIPRSNSIKHIAQNADLYDFKLTQNDMKKIRALKRS